MRQGLSAEAGCRWTRRTMQDASLPERMRTARFGVIVYEKITLYNVLTVTRSWTALDLGILANFRPRGVDALCTQRVSGAHDRTLSLVCNRMRVEIRRSPKSNDAGRRCAKRWFLYRVCIHEDRALDSVSRSLELRQRVGSDHADLHDWLLEKNDSGAFTQGSLQGAPATRLNQCE